MKTIFKILLLSPFLMATTCDDEFPTLYANPIVSTVSPHATYNTNDTIWIQGRTSSRAYNTTTRDSVFNDVNLPFCSLRVYKLVLPENRLNTSIAIDKFGFIQAKGAFTLLESCNGGFAIEPELSQDSMSYIYKLGLKALAPGDYMIRTDDSTINNNNIHTEISNKYQIPQYLDYIEMTSCYGNSDIQISTAKQLYFFTIL